MIVLLVYYLVLPMLTAWAVISFIKKYGRHEIAEDILTLYAEKPLDKGWFRALRRDHKGLRLLGDCETHDEAVDLAYKGKEEAQTSSERAAFLVLNHQGETLDEVDS